MFLHIGEGHMIPEKEIVFIGDLESARDSKITREFFSVSEEEGFVVNYFDGEPRSFILTGETIYLSIISSETLRKRLNRPIGNGGV
ncbi:MAG: extracellular matrix regulator RemB [Halanaerobiales bacterium]